MKDFPLSSRYVYSGVVCVVWTESWSPSASDLLMEVKTTIERKTLLGIGLLAVTGLDLLPTLYIWFAGHVWLDDMELWNEAQITSWAGSLLWVPHHVAALIACFVAFLLLRHQADANRWATAL